MLRYNLLLILLVMILDNVILGQIQDSTISRLNSEIKKIRSDNDLFNASLGIYAVDIETGKVISDINSNVSLVPASTLKIITTAAALEIFGSDHQFFTIIGYEGKIDNTGVLNGDIIDGARVSRHGSTLGSAAPKVSAEIDAAKKWMDQLPKCKRRIFTIGNHDMRVDNYLANQASELEDYAGRLADRFPMWEFCYSFQLNEDVEFRHRFRAGIHAAYNNAQVSGWTTVTNHTHAQQLTAVRNRRGSHWGVETGMLGDPNHKAFQYGEGAPTRAHQGFAVLTFDETGILMPPEFCQMINGRPVFRGKYVL